MALLKLYEADPKLDLLQIVDPTNIVDINIQNKTGEILNLTFVKDKISGKTTRLVADDTIPLDPVYPGETVTVTAQQINDAIAAGDHSDIYFMQYRDEIVSTVPKIVKVYAGQTTPVSKSKKSKD